MAGTQGQFMPVVTLEGLRWWRWTGIPTARVLVLGDWPRLATAPMWSSLHLLDRNRPEKCWVGLNIKTSTSVCKCWVREYGMLSYPALS